MFFFEISINHSQFKDSLFEILLTYLSWSVVQNLM
jgi:hypothetical protein